MNITFSARQKFDKTGVIVESKFAQTEFVGTYSPDGILKIDWYETTVNGRGVGTEMISRAIENVGFEKVKSVVAQLGNKNLQIFDAGISSGLSIEKAVWNTPLGKSMSSLGFNKIEISQSFVKFLY